MAGLHLTLRGGAVPFAWGGPAPTGFSVSLPGVNQRSAGWPAGEVTGEPCGRAGQGRRRLPLKLLGVQI